MASKGKDKIKLKKHEIEFNKKRIDLKRFAYDIMKYTALKFRVPESCIAVWDGPANDYGHDDFCLVVCRKIILCQLAERCRYHTFFMEHYERNKLATPELIGRLLLEVINKEMEKLPMPTLVKVGVSLAVLCELFLFLYSEDLYLCPKQLATHWFQSYLNINKKKFENAGGFGRMYLNGSIKKFDDVDGFINKFIEDHCLPYKTTANDPVVVQLFIRLFQNRIPKSAKSLSEKDAEKIEETVKSVTEMLKRQHRDVDIEEVVVVPLPASDEASGINVPQNIDFERISHDMLLQLVGPSVASPQDPSAASPEGKPRRRRRLSYKQRMEKEIEASEVDLLSNPGLGVPLPHEMYDFSFSVDAAQSQKLPEESVQELSKHTKGPSHRERSGKPISRASVEQGFEQPSSDSSETKKPIVTRTPPKSPYASSPEEQPQHHGTLSYKQRMKMIKSGLRANVEQGIGQLSSDAYEMKQFSRKTPSVPRTLVPSPSATSPEDQSRRPGILTDEEILKILSTSDDESPLTSKREETSGVDLLSNPGLGVPLPHEMYDFSFSVDAAQSQKLPEESVQELSKHTKGSSHRESRKPSTRASVEQGFGQPSSDSSETKKPIVTRTPPKGPSESSPEEQPQHHGTLSYKQRMKMIKSGLRANVEQGLEQLSSDAYEMKKFSRKTPSVPRTLVPSPSATSPEDQSRRPGILTDEEVLKILSTSDDESPLTSKRKETSGVDLLSNPGLGVPLPHEMFDFLLADVAELSENLTEHSVQESSKDARRSSHREKRNRKPSLRASVDQGLAQPSSDSSETKKPIVTRTPPKSPSASSPEEQPQSHGTLSYKQRMKMMKSGLRANVEQGLGQLSSDAYEMKQFSRKTPSVPRTLVPSPSATSPEDQSRRPGILTDEEILKILSTSDDESPLTSKREETSGVDLLSNPGLGVPLPHEMYDFSFSVDAAQSQKLPEESVQELSKHTKGSSHRERRNRKPSLRASVDQGLAQPSSDSSETKRPIFIRSVASPKDPPATNPEEKPRRPRIGDEEIAKILSICEEESLTSKQGETSEVDLPSNPGLGVPLPYEIYEFPSSFEAAQSQKLPDENVQELSKHTKGSFYRERSRIPRPRASLEKGLGQPSSDSSETKKPFVTRTVTSKGLSASSPKEQPQHHRTLSYKQRMEMIKSGLRASVKQDLGQPSTDSYEIKHSSKKTSSVPRTLVPSQDPSTPEEQPRRPRNLTDEQIAKILRNLTDEEIAKILSISEEESPLASKRDETSEVDLPSNLGLGVPLSQEVYDFPLTDVAELSQNLPEERAQETPKHATKLSHRERRDGKPSLRASVEQGLEQPRSDSSETKKPIVTRTVASPKGPSASSSEEQPQHHRTLSYKQRMKMIKSGLRASVEPGFGQASLDSSMATDTMQSYELQGVRPRVPKQKKGASGLQTGESSSPKTRVDNTGSSGLQKTKSRGERKKKIQEE